MNVLVTFLLLWSRQHIEEKVYWGLTLSEGSVHDLRGRKGGRQAGMALEQIVESSYLIHKLQAMGWELVWAFEPLKPTAQWHLLQQGPPPNPSQTVPPTGDQAFKHGPIQAFLIQTTR